MRNFQAPNGPFWPNQAPLNALGMNPYTPGWYGQVQPQMPAQPQSFAQPQSYPGRPVNSVDEIQPNEVPMDGTLTLFPKKDGSCIYAKAWDTDGTIKTLVYNLDTPVTVVDETPAPLPVTLDDLNEFASKVSDAIDEGIEKKLGPFNNQLASDLATSKDYQMQFSERLSKIEEMLGSLKRSDGSSILLK